MAVRLQGMRQGKPRRGLLRNAVIAKDVRTRMRSRHPVTVVTLYMAALAIVLAVFLVQHNGLTSDEPAHPGIELFAALAIVQLCLIVLVTPITVAGAVSAERQRQTWDLLLVTPLSSFAIVWGKMAAGIAFNLPLIFAPLPLLGAVFLFGGVTPGDLLRTYAVFLITILLLTSVSLLVSVLSRRPTVSMLLCLGVSLLLGAGLSLAVVLAELGPQLTGLTDPGVLASLPSSGPPLTPVAQLDPLAALLSVLPDGSGGSVLGNLGVVHHAFGLPLRLSLWEAFGILTLAISGVCLGVSSAFIRGAALRGGPAKRRGRPATDTQSVPGAGPTGRGAATPEARP